MIEKMETDIEEGKKAIKEKEFSKGIKKLQKVLKEETENEKAKEIQLDTTEYLDSV